jgi:hypothetical protein
VSGAQRDQLRIDPHISSGALEASNRLNVLSEWH